MSQPEFTIEDILRELGADNEGDGITVQEIVKASGKCPNWVHKRVAMAIDAGTMEYVGDKPDKRIDGRKCLKPVYRLKRGGENE